MKKKENEISFSDFANLSTLGMPANRVIRNLLSGNKSKSVNESHFPDNKNQNNIYNNEKKREKIELKQTIDQLIDQMNYMKKRQDEIMQLLYKIDERIDSLENRGNKLEKNFHDFMNGLKNLANDI